MSELINKNDNRATIRWKLLTGVSVLALTTYVSSTPVRAEDASQPLIWLDLGGQLSGLNDGQETFAPPIMDARPAILAPSQRYEYPPRFSIDEFAKLSYQPDNSDWVFSASLRYGRSASKRRVHQQTQPLPTYRSKYFSGANHRYAIQPIAARFSDTNAQNGETHRILDFQAGKDVGLGIFGSANGSSTLNFGVRFAQFASKSNIALKSDPDAHFTRIHFQFYYYNFTFTKQVYHSNAATLRAARNFHGVGPSLSWNASAPFAGDLQDGQLSLDWSVNAALLFGRQRTKVHHQTTGQYHPPKYGLGYRNITYQPAPFDQTRSRSVTVPNVGGSLGLSYRIENFKVAFGYRADLFMNAIDGGIDKAKKENRAFFGPYASISIGIGD